MATLRTGDYALDMNPTFKRLALVMLAAAFFSIVTTGCQTSKGFGKDVENLGDSIQKKAS
jgi:predicted small secreted protein